MSDSGEVVLDPAVKRRLRRFMAHSFQTGSYARLDSLPLPRLNPDWSNQHLWVAAGLASFDAAREIRDELRHPLIAAVTFSLSGDGDEPPHDRGQLARELSDTAPAVSLFEVGSPFLSDPPVRDVTPARLGLRDDPDVAIELIVWEPPGEPPVRSLVISSRPGRRPVD